MLTVAMTKKRLTQIRRKHERAIALLREAHELAMEERSGNGHVLSVTAAAADAASRIERDWTQLDERERRQHEAIASQQRELEEYGRCTKCNTGASARHLHCRACGWSMFEFGPGAGTCSNSGACELAGREQEGVRYSDHLTSEEG